MKSLLTFVIGAGIGAAISWVYHKNKYEEIIQEEITSLRANSKLSTFASDKKNDDKTNQVGYEEDNSKTTINKARNIIDYNGYSKNDEPEIGPCEAAARRNPLYVITPEEFASQLGYDTDTFYLFADDIITNDNNEVLSNVKEMFGITIDEIKDQYGKYEDNAVYVRDERIQMDYEILKELGPYEKRNGE